MIFGSSYGAAERAWNTRPDSTYLDNDDEEEGEDAMPVPAGRYETPAQARERQARLEAARLEILSHWEKPTTKNHD